MPMKRLSTQCINRFRNEVRQSRGKLSSPSRQTLDFLSQFARCYHVEPMLQTEYCGFVMN